jgi:hypothetical protein
MSIAKFKNLPREYQLRFVLATCTQEVVPWCILEKRSCTINLGFVRLLEVKLNKF